MLHVIYRLAEGGLENGLVNLVNQLPRERFDHAVLALDAITDFSSRIQREDVELHAFHKPAGHGVRVYPRFLRLLRKLRPAVVHTRGLAALEMAPVARLLGIPVIHGEHGWDAHDALGRRRKYQWLRRLYRPFVTHYIAVSQQISDYLTTKVGVGAAQVTRICNGVDVMRWQPALRRVPIEGGPFNDPSLVVVGSVGRMAAVKDPLSLVAAFAQVVSRRPELRLVMVGDGELMPQVRAAVAAAGLQQKVWLAGARADVVPFMRGFDLFVLPSLAEGISNTVLEAMACGLPVIATDVGGNGELVVPGRTGVLVAPGEAGALGRAIELMGDGVRGLMGREGRRRVVEGFSLEGMVARYAEVYERVAG